MEKKQNSMMKRSIGGLLKARRLEQKLTLQEVAKRAELSAAFLSQAERGKATPSIVSLINIARALGTDIHYFISPPSPAELVSKGDDPQYLNIDSPVSYRVLNASIPNQQMSALLMEIPPGVELPTVHREEGEDIFYIISGEVEQLIGDKVFSLKAGDCVHMNTQLDHNIVNKGDSTATILWAGTPVLLPVA
ncbi:XRE family transcriptional regulator [Kineobactrum sediminis]|uniref:XRE family transcriptional regulator n=1 Tax=Kineobactrum sediminis TaxID=1905677 RepID=A0A2N5Y5F3_9GAMM|nr:XRE family transcriptional regulator [Kineobactrum sediminis]PLW83625.1 XRE family transcriptional regulator [Kineobactrum sediminis]